MTRCRKERQPLNRAPVKDAAKPEVIEEAGRLIRQGGLVAFPTETVYGLGADACNPRAAARIFEAKQRPEFDPLIVHVPDQFLAARYGDAGFAILTIVNPMVSSATYA